VSTEGLTGIRKSKDSMDDCSEKNVVVLQKISRSQDKLYTLMESLDRRINGRK